MSIAKKALDFVLWDVLRIRRPKYRGSIDGIRSSTVTLRTYTEDGDPFDDLIEFYLRNRPGVPSGFRMPNDTKGDDVGKVVDEAEIRRAFGVKD